MKRRPLASWLLLGLLAVPLAAVAQAHPTFDECDGNFIAYLGANAYQFSPAHPGDLGKVRLFTVLSDQEVAAYSDFGQAFWRLEIHDGLGNRVRTARGAARIEFEGQAQAEFLWDGRDDQGRLVPAGLYTYTFRARFLPDRVADAEPRQRGAARYEDLQAGRGVVEAAASTDEVIVRYDLDQATAKSLRESLAAGSCQAQQHAPLESGFGYNFYYGSTHSHSNWSDGGQPTSNCSSGNAYGSGTFDPAAIYSYARNTAGLDYWVVNEHNHLMEDAMATNNPPVTESKVRSRYASGLAEANAATVNDAFVGIYGMEWGVLTNTDQGHVTLLETPKLFGWETCTNCTGATAECTPGTNCYFDIYTPKRFGYLTMYKRSVENPSAAGALGILCHPETGQFDNYAFNADADAALQGIAVRSGLAFNTATNCADANVASTDYVPLWQQALNKGFHIGPTADHDAHCNTYGQGLPNRTVYLLRNNTSPVLTKLALLQAHKARHFFASEDSNAQLVFATSDGAHIMGDIFSVSGSVTLRAAVYDPAAEAVSRVEVWRGQIGGGVPTSAYRTATGTSTLSFTESLSSGTYYYYVHAVQADGHDLWSSPMWITYGSGGGGTSLDISGWHVVQRNSSVTYTIPTGTSIPAGGYVIIARDATKSAFESFWRAGSPLPSNVVYVNSAGLIPLINGSEDFTLTNTSGTTIDGPTIAMSSAAGNSVQRKDPCLAANLSTSWNVTSASSATPGTGAGAGCAKGVVINEFSDALGTNNFVYEFVELHYDN